MLFYRENMTLLSPSVPFFSEPVCAKLWISTSSSRLVPCWIVNRSLIKWEYIFIYPFQKRWSLRAPVRLRTINPTISKSVARLELASLFKYSILGIGDSSLINRGSVQADRSSQISVKPNIVEISWLCSLLNMKLNLSGSMKRSKLGSSWTC